MDTPVFQKWTSDMKYMDSSVQGPSLTETQYEPDLPPIRSGNITLTADGVSCPNYIWML